MTVVLNTRQCPIGADNMTLKISFQVKCVAFVVEDLQEKQRKKVAFALTRIMMALAMFWLITGMTDVLHMQSLLAGVVNSIPNTTNQTKCAVFAEAVRSDTTHLCQFSHKKRLTCGSDPKNRSILQETQTIVISI